MPTTPKKYVRMVNPTLLSSIGYGDIVEALDENDPRVDAAIAASHITHRNNQLFYVANGSTALAYFKYRFVDATEQEYLEQEAKRNKAVGVISYRPGKITKLQRECGAHKVGAANYSPSHSSWCPVYSKDQVTRKLTEEEKCKAKKEGVGAQVNSVLAGH